MQIAHAPQSHFDWSYFYSLKCRLPSREREKVILILGQTFEHMQIAHAPQSHVDWSYFYSLKRRLPSREREKVILILGQTD